MRLISASYWDLRESSRRWQRGAVRRQVVALDRRRLGSGRDFGENGRITDGSSVVRLDERRRSGWWRGWPGRTSRCGRWRRGRGGGAVRAVYDLDPPAGGGAQAAFSAAAHHAGGPGSLRGRLHHLHADRLDHPVGRGPEGGPVAGPSLYGAAYVPERPRALRQEGQERPGGPRGHPPRRREVPHPGGDRAARRSAPALRTGVDADGGVADGRRGGPERACPAGRRLVPGEDAEFGTSGRVITFPGFLRAYVEGSDDPDAELEDREVRLPALAVGEAP